MAHYAWQGGSGRWFDFEVVRAKRDWEPLPGVYMFVKPGDQSSHEGAGPVVLYIAKTSSFADALARHEMWGHAHQLGAQEIHLLPVTDDASRLRIEKDLLEAQTPILNKQMLRRVA